MRRIYSPFVLLALCVGLVACPSQTTKKNSSGKSCSVSDNLNGSYTLTCPDGSSVTIADGTSCSVDGDDGINSITCSDGSSVSVTNGEDALDLLVRLVNQDKLDEEDSAWQALVTEELSTACPDGGTILFVGVDKNSDEQLSPDEVVDYDLICNGAQGEDGAQGQDGVDGADGDDGISVVVTNESVPVGDTNCSEGGIKVTAWQDNNANDERDEGEEAVTYVCNGEPWGMLAGDFVIEDAVDVSLLDRFNQINGNLTVNAPGLTSLVLPDLNTVTGDFNIEDGSALTTLDLGLREVDGDLKINNTALTNLSGFGSLTSVGGTLTISNNTALVSLDGLESLTSLGDDLDISGNAVLTDISALSGVSASLSGDVTISANAALASLNGLEGMTSVGGNLTISNNAKVRTLSDLSNLASVTGTLTISSNVTLTLLGLASLVTASNAQITSNTELPLCFVDDLAEPTGVSIADDSGNYTAYAECPKCDDDGTTRQMMVALPGELLITEAFADPDGLASVEGVKEWFEIKNIGAYPLDLNRLVVMHTNDGATEQEFSIDNGVSGGVFDCVRVESGAYAVIGVSTDPSVNGGINPVATAPDMTLRNGELAMELQRDNHIIDDLGVVGNSAEGSSLALGPLKEQSSQNNSAEDFCAGTDETVFEEK
ncbi:MAG: hypothetical protein QGI45_00665, partial [Myxococcota bacterium]|nr:hypothetical protein [Myxococcota bacterium]